MIFKCYKCGGISFSLKKTVYDKENGKPICEDCELKEND